MKRNYQILQDPDDCDQVDQVMCAVLNPAMVNLTHVLFDLGNLSQMKLSHIEV